MRLYLHLFLVEVESVTTAGGRLAEISYGDQQFHFGEAEWKKLFTAKGDFSVLGHTLEKARPVPDFHLILKHYDDLKRCP